MRHASDTPSSTTENTSLIIPLEEPELPKGRGEEEGGGAVGGETDNTQCTPI